jgi:hypothetical protein
MLADDFPEIDPPGDLPTVTVVGTPSWLPMIAALILLFAFLTDK